MTVAAPTAAKWTCARCGVAVRRIDGKRTALPDTWAKDPDGCYCLTCRRERAAETALEAAPEGCSSEVKAKARRAGLIEFEVRRAPDRADGAIARACHTSASAVATTRRAIGRR